MGALINPAVVVNNQPVAIKPNSFSYTEGFGEFKTRVQTAGPGSIENINTEDVETQKSMVKFTLLTTTENIDIARQWKANFDQNSITATAPDFSRSFGSALLMTDVEIAAGQEGEFEVEFTTRRAA